LNLSNKQKAMIETAKAVLTFILLFAFFYGLFHFFGFINTMILGLIALIIHLVRMIYTTELKNLNGE